MRTLRDRLEDRKAEEGTHRIRIGQFSDGVILIKDGRISSPNKKDPSVLLAGAKATVESVGDLSSRITATRLLATGPLALALRKKKDQRQLFLTVEGTDGAFVCEITPKSQQDARQAAAAINALAGQAAPTAQGSDTTLDQLEKLGQLRDRGVLTEDEFQAQKAKVLAS